jgi:excisionase family DNA binding protein
MAIVPVGVSLMSELLAVSEVAEHLRISVRQVWKLNASGSLPSPIRLGRSVRWRAAELSAWIAEGCPCRDQWVVLREAAR